MLCCTASCRVTIVDDARGVGEPLNETLCGCTGSSCDCLAGGLPARGKHLLVLGPTGTAAAGLRAAQQQLNDALVLAFSDLGSAAQQQRQKGTGAVAGRHTSTAAASIQQQQQQGEGVIAALDLQARWSGVAEAVLTAGGLPPNVHLLTLMRAEECDPSQLILRLAHTFQVGHAAALLIGLCCAAACCYCPQWPVGLRLSATAVSLAHMLAL